MLRTLAFASLCLGIALALPIPPSPEATPINVFVVAHSHCDPGWLKTVQEYYDDDVVHILDTSIAELAKNPERRFTWVEQSFFSRWWAHASEEQKSLVRNMTASGQLEFNLGGWVMADEAATTYYAIINQLTEGHEYLREILNAKPRVAWHIDPFGHSKATPELFALAGFDALVGNRINYALKNELKKTQGMEMVWEGDMPVNGHRSRLFFHLLDSHYSSPAGFDFEGWSWAPPPPDITPTTVKAKAEELADILKERAAWYKTPNLLIPLGDDFKFKNATAEFYNWDQLMAFFKEHGSDYGINMQYAVLSDYIKAVHDENTTWPLFQDDFMPYADDDHAFWTGYYSSRPKIKGQIRAGESTLRAVESAHAVRPDTGFEQVQVLRRALALVQHHDGVTGTMKTHVLEDYEERIATGVEEADKVGAQAVASLVAADQSEGVALTANNNALADIAEGQAVPVVVYNSIGWDTTRLISVPAPHCKLTVTTLDGSAVKHQVSLIAGESTLHFVAEDIPALGHTTYLVSYAAKEECVEPSPVAAGTSASISNGKLEVSVSASSHRVASVRDLETKADLPLDTELFEYHSIDYFTRKKVTHCEYFNTTDLNCPTPNSQSSGAYIFRPKGDATAIGPKSLSVSVVNGAAVSELVLDFGEDKRITYRLPLLPKTSLLAGVLEAIHTVSIASPDRELVVRFDTNLDTKGVFYTDDSALRWMARKYNSDTTEPIAANYYPVQVASAIADDKNALLVVTDRSHGASSLADGSLEVMLHRRCSVDDGRGLDEALEDLDTVSPTLWITPVPSADLARTRHTLSTLRQGMPAVYFGAVPMSPTSLRQRLTPSGSLLAAPLPENVHLLTLAARDAKGEETVVRLQHLYAKEEDAKLGQPVTVDVEKLFAASAGTVTSAEERTLTLLHPVSQVERLSWRVEGRDEEIRDNVDSTELQPLQIRTFVVKLTPRD